MDVGAVEKDLFASPSPEVADMLTSVFEEMHKEVRGVEETKDPFFGLEQENVKQGFEEAATKFKKNKVMRWTK